MLVASLLMQIHNIGTIKLIMSTKPEAQAKRVEHRSQESGHLHQSSVGIDQFNFNLYVCMPRSKIDKQMDNDIVFIIGIIMVSKQ